jgi:hypothetical protein
MFQALVEIAVSVSEGELYWEVTAPNTVCFQFRSKQQAVELPG